MGHPCAAIASSNRGFRLPLTQWCQGWPMRVFGAAHPGELFRLLGQEPIDVVFLDSQSSRFPDSLILQTLESVAGTDMQPDIVRVGTVGASSYLSKRLRIESVSKSEHMWDDLAAVSEAILRPRNLDESQIAMIREPRPVWKLFGKILCIDDDVKFTRLLQIRMAEYGIEVTRASTGIEGFDQAVRHRPDAIVTDFVMPEGLGSYMLGRLKDCDINIPVVFLVDELGQGHEAFEHQMIELGAARVLKKPLKFRDLLTELRNHFPFPDPDVRQSWPEGMRLDDPHANPRKRRRGFEPRISNLYYPKSGNLYT